MMFRCERTGHEVQKMHLMSYLIGELSHAGDDYSIRRCFVKKWPDKACFRAFFLRGTVEDGMIKGRNNIMS